VLIRLHIQHFICKLCLKVQNNEFILPWENARRLIGILKTINEEKHKHEEKGMRKYKNPVG